MGIAADREHARPEVPAFRQHHVADALHVVEMRDAVGRDPFTRQVEDGGAVGVNRRYVVVADDDDLVRIPDLGA